MGVNQAKAMMFDTQLLASTIAGALYMFSSIGMVFVNKATMMAFPNANILLFMQMASAIFLVRILLAKLLLPVTLLYTANVGFGLTAVAALNVPMYNALKRLTPVFILCTKSIITKSMPPWQITGSVFLIVFGCIVAGVGDLTFHLPSYLYALASCLLQTAYLLLVERTGAEKDATTTELLYYNSVLSLPFVVLLVLGTGEAWQAMSDFAAGAVVHGDSGLMALIIVCSLSGILLNFALFWSTQLNSALTTTIIGVFKGVVTTVLGFFILGGVKFHSVLDVHLIGIIINTIGGIWYTVVKYNQRRERLANAKNETAPLSAFNEANGAEKGAMQNRTGVTNHATEQTPLLRGNGGKGHGNVGKAV